MSGPSPAGNVQGNLPQSTVKYYDKDFRQNLKSQTPFVACAEPLELPTQRGNNYNIFQYDKFPANTSAPSEGDPEALSSLEASVLTTDFTIGELADYANFSSLALATAIDPVVENVGREMAYRLGESLSALVRTVADGAYTIDASAQYLIPATSTSSYSTLSRTILSNQVQSMAGRAIRPFDEKNMAFAGVIHPFATGDVLANTENGIGVLEILKHTAEGQMKMEDLVGVDLAETISFPATGVRFFQSNLVTILSDYNPGAGAITGLSALSTYIFGRDGVFAVRLGANGDTAFGNGMWQSIKTYMKQNVEPSSFDPSGLIPGFTSYKVHFTAGLGPDPVQRLRVIIGATGVS